jgi:pimeloyl-ACP methyl ester carboxylesterase
VNPQVCAAEKLISPPPYIYAGAQFSGRMLFDAIGQEDMNAFAKRFAVPVVFIQGSDDLLTTTSVVKQYFEEIKAPHKDFVELPGAGHLAIFRDPDAFLSQLVAKVRPLAMREHP